MIFWRPFILRDTDLIHHFPFLMTFSDLEIHVTLSVFFIMSELIMIIFMLDLVLPLGLGVLLESKVGRYPSDEITCWRLTPVFYIFLGCPRGICFYTESRDPESATS